LTRVRFEKRKRGGCARGLEHADRALVVTQANSLAALGIPPRRFRELLRELGLPVVELGKLRAVEARVFLEAIRKRVPAPAAPVESNRERLLKIAGLK
jgi:hypothetical protein